MTWTNSGGRSVPHKLQQACFRRDRWTCQGCGYKGRQRKGDLHADHIDNRAEGGPDELDNLQTLCDPCHEVKTARERARGKQRRSGKRKPRVHPADVLRGNGAAAQGERQPARRPTNPAPAATPSRKPAGQSGNTYPLA